MTSKPRAMRLAIAGGGTGGHVLPALAVLNDLRQQNLIDEVIWLGSRDGVEGDAARNAGVPFTPIPTGKLRRYLSLSNLTDAARIPAGVIAARRMLWRFRPDVVLSTGGFVSVPTVVAARGIAPVVTHEQTAILGLANRINARFASVLAISHQQTEPEARRVHRQVAVTGNPVRPELVRGNRERGLSRFGFSPELPLIYVTGGARGASPINQRVAALLPEILERAQVLHQTGPANANKDAELLRAQREQLPAPRRARYAVVEYVRDELPDVYAAADIVVGRSGAGTVAELALVGLPAIFIPLPGAGGDEQMVNARVLGDIGAAIVLRQDEATPDRLLQALRSILDDPDCRTRMADAARSAARPEAAAQLAGILVSIAGGRQPTRAR